MSRITITVLWIVLLAHAACKSAERSTPVERSATVIAASAPSAAPAASAAVEGADLPDAAELAGSWCIATNPLTHNLLLTKPPPDKIRSSMRAIRVLEALRIRMQGAEVTLEQQPQAPYRGGLSFETRGPAQHFLRVHWESEAMNATLPPHLDGRRPRLCLDVELRPNSHA